jgi:hypothetical protein
VLRPRDLLRRFRLIAVPGRAELAGVPTDRVVALREELAPVFLALRTCEVEIGETVSRAGAEAERRRESSLVASQRLLADANDALVGERLAAARDSEVETTTSCSLLQARADEEVRRLDSESPAKMSLVVDDVVRRVLAQGVSSRVST